MKIHFLGTSATIPTLERNVSSIAIENFNQIILFDCGEGTLLQFKKKKLKLSKISKIFITHFHGDHFLGIPAFLMTFALFKRTKSLELYGPPGLQKYIEFIKNFIESSILFNLKIIELKDSDFFKFNNFSIKVIETNHNIQNFSLKYIEKAKYGKFDKEKAKMLNIPNNSLRKKLKNGNEILLANGVKISPEDVCGPIIKEKIVIYSGDTAPSKKLEEFSMNANVIIMESTFFNDLKQKAIETGHSTLEDGIKLASRAKANNLILTHFSSRYKSLELFNDYIKELKSEINIILARDFLTFEF